MLKLTGDNETSCENELLVCCARVSQSTEVRNRLDELLRGPLDWQTVLDRCWWHRIRPLTFRHLGGLPAGVVPAAFLTLLGSHVQELEQRNRRLQEGQLQITQLFEQSSLPMLVFKGLTLATDAYGDLGLRECGDIDVLIRQSDFARAKEVLISNGFDCLWDQADSQRNRQLFACEFQRDGIELDVHWDLAPKWHNYRVDFDYLWSEGQPIEKDGQFARKMRPEDALVILCMHGTRHWWERLRWICDIAEVVNSGIITDWNRLEETAIHTRCHRPTWLGLWLAHDLLDANLPQDVLGKLEQLPVLKRLGAQVRGWLANADQARESRKLPGRFLFRMRLCERWRDRIPQIAHYLKNIPSRRVKRNP